MAVLAKVSLAVTVTETGVPPLAVAGAVTVKDVAPAGLTVIEPWVPVIEAVTVSVAVMARVPEVLRVALKVWAPLSAATKV